MGLDFYSIHELIGESELADKALQLIEDEGNQEVTDWFNNAVLSSYGGRSPKAVLEQFGLEEFRCLLLFKAEGGFE